MAHIESNFSSYWTSTNKDWLTTKTKVYDLGMVAGSTYT